MEIWRPVVGFEGYYEVSNLGDVRSLPRLDANNHKRGGHLIKPRVNRGYLYVHLRKDGGDKNLRLHRVVLEAFVGPCPLGMEGCHGPNGRFDNSLENLRWDTPTANAADKERDGTSSRGECNGGGGKLTETSIPVIRSMIDAGKKTYAEIGAAFGVGKSMIGHIAAGRAWSHVT